MPLPPLAQIPPQIAAVADYEAYARERLDDAAWAYLAGGAADELTLRANREAFDRVRIQPRVLGDMTGGGTSLDLLGVRLSYPILLAPVAFQKLAHPQGELATVLAASAMKAAMVVSTQASVALEDLARAAETPLWFQLYFQADRNDTLRLARRAEAAGYRALVVTVDAPVNGVRNREQRAGFALPAGIEAVNLRGMRPMAQTVARAGESAVFGSGALDAAPSWEDIAWLRTMTGLPVVLKGILAPADARLAVEAGASAIIVSNHGGRTLDTAPATLEALPWIAAEVRGRIPILMDGGIRRGTDVFKAIALGAAAVLIGRGYLHGLAAAGTVGVIHVLHMLRTEFEIAMALAGCRTLADIDRAALWTHPAPGQL
ncbi:alpha-hydroxy-acid oxidizing enzyme [Pigmentiphaga sp. NML080357]|uniref:alpha-hydroxy acid oxidase n=1 Tax=Pigmentiphaga sp. NML080357 TaxID=2008675 RepID=UPI000B42293F|nr:alpha-hydroxy acid oxidase [Pigmentiphaga sp. NML080357]OVZ57673.1 alpha-hydroxy-acid oxidizing enzyme [Pigmentiphaga sp. NML080357]